MTDTPSAGPLGAPISKLTSRNVEHVRRLLLSAATFDEQIEVESLLDALWSIADIAVTRIAMQPEGPSGSQSGSVLMERLGEIRRLLHVAHDCGAEGETRRSAKALEEARTLLEAHGGELRGGV